MKIEVETPYNIWDVIYYRKKIYTDKLSYTAQQFISKFDNLAEIKKWYIWKIDVNNKWEITYRCWENVDWWYYDLVNDNNLIWDIEKARSKIILDLLDFFSDSKMEELLKANTIRDRLALYIK